MSIRKLLLLGLLALLAATLACGPLNAVRDILRDFGRAYCEDPLLVTKVGDTNDGVCGDDDCSLREAVIAANQCEGEQRIHLEAGATYVLSIEGSDEDEAATGDLDILEDTRFYLSTSVLPDEPAPEYVTVDAQGLDRVFDVHDGQASFFLTILRGGEAENGGALRIAAGASVNMFAVDFMDNTADHAGGGVYNEGAFEMGGGPRFTGNDAQRGAAIYTAGAGSSYSCHFDRNEAEQGVIFVDRGGDLELELCTLFRSGGGAIVNRGSVRLFKFAMVDNSGIGSSGAVATGAALFNEPGASFQMENGTISGNRIIGGSGAVILNLGEVAFNNVTIFQNGPADLAISNPSDGETRLHNTILAESGDRDCHGGVVSEGHNLFKFGTNCPANTSTGDIVLPNPETSLGLVPSSAVFEPDLPAPAYVPAADSPAVDSGGDPCPEQDIWHTDRPLDGDGDGDAVCDIGAVELEAMEALSLETTPLPSPTFDLTPIPDATPILPPIVVEDTLCWKGPGSEYETVSSLLTGTEVELLGRGEIEGWWVIDNPRYPGVPCWTPEDDLQVDPEAVPPELEIFPVPPLPTLTPTPILGCLYQGPNDNQPVCYPIENCPVDFEDSLGACTP